MYLKKIILQGFKSFADKTEIDFDKNITGIVGPNGSGKSNVVDAVRWVLGEQSVKSLRGDNSMTDVIFSGSKDRKGSGSASVTLVFDNSDSYLPLDFNEVEIRRRVYKDGINEYFINNEKCRLKDINDLIIDSGMAKEAFNIIGQGKIDEIISSKPTDRRVIFEEAAGVLKYKKRKEEAIRKLTRTSENMTRINDIILEIENQINPLKRQKEEALKYQELSEELKGIEIALSVHDITNLNHSYKKLKEEVEIKNNNVARLASLTGDLDVKELEYQNHINELNTKINETQSKLLDVTKETEQLNSQKMLVIERKNYELDNDKTREGIIALTTKKEELKVNLNKLETKLNNYENDIKIVMEKSNSLNKDIEDEMLNKRKLDVSLTNLIKDRQLLETKIDNLENIIESSLNLPISVKSVLNNPKLDGILDYVGGIIKTDNKYETALTTVLGSNINNIITKDEKSAKEAINYLNEAKLGRATFYPIDVIKGRYIDNETISKLNTFKSYEGTLSNLVSYPDKFKNIIDNLLGNVVVINNIDEAIKTARSINYRYRIVTLRGEVINVGGSLTGGINKQRNIINDKNTLNSEIKNLEMLNLRIESLEKDINENNTNLRSIEDELYLNNKKLSELNTDYNSLKHSIEIVQKELFETENSLNGLKTLNEDNTKEEELVINKYYESVKEKENVTNILNNLIKERSNYNQLLEESIHNRKRENSLYNSEIDSLKKLEIELNRCDVKLDSLLTNLSSEYNLTYEYAKSLYTLELEENIARNRVNKLKSSLKSLGPVNLNAIEEYKKVSERYEFLLNQKNDLENAKETLLNIINEMDKVVVKEFKKTFDIVNKHFNETFKDLFRGGSASLTLTDPDNLLETGVEIAASPPGKKLTSINLLSGGEKTFTAISLLFAILKSREVPFLILDEVEAALDEANVEAFGDYLINLSHKNQFILITHKKKTMEYVNTLYGITMQEAGISKLVSVRLEEIKE